MPSDDTTHTTSAAGKSDRKRSPWSGWIKRAGILIAVVLIIGGTGLWIITRSWFIIAQVQPELEQRLGGHVSVAYASYVGSGQFRFTDVLVRSRELTGPASEVLRIDHIEVTTDPASWRSGTPSITAVRIEGVRMRISEDASAPGQFNFMTLKPQWPESDLDDASTLPPNVIVSGALVQMCQHNIPGDESFLVVGERRFSGRLEPGDGTLFQFLLAETDEYGNQLDPSGMTAHGAWDVQTNAYSCRLEGLRLDERTFSVSPSHVREWWRRMDLRGEVSSAVIEWEPQQIPELRLNVSSVALTLPIDNEGFWARYRDGEIETTPSRPRLKVNDGAIVLRPNTAELVELRGALVSGELDDAAGMVDVPYRINMSVSLPDQNQRGPWFDQVWSHAAFDLDFELERFDMSMRSETGQVPAVDLPAVVAQALQRFEMRKWILETQVNISRAPPLTDDSGNLVALPILSEGRALIDEATCAYDKFPYPMTNVSATIHFDNDVLEIIGLTGRSSNGQPIRLTGRITPLDITAGANLRITGAGIALDQVLRDALPEQSRRAFDALFDAEAHQRAQASGVLPTAEDIKRYREERRRIMTDLRDTDVDSLSDPERKVYEHKQAEAARLARIIEAGPFELGGEVDLDLRVTRNVGRGQPTVIAGDMDIRRAHIMYDRFPYPMMVQAGTLEWTYDAISIGESTDEPLSFITPGGGAGRASGAIHLLHGPVRVEPELNLDVIGDRVNAAVFQAIPANANRDVQIADVLDSLHLDAILDYAGVVNTDETGSVQYAFTVVASNGEAHPDAEITEMVGMSGVYWPESLTLENVEAHLLVRPDGVTLDQVTAHHAGGRIAASGVFGGANGHTNLTVDFEDMPVDSYLVDLAPSNDEQRLRQIWDRYKPTGRFDAHILYDDAKNEGHPVLRFEPNRINVQVADSQFAIAREAGSIDIERGFVTFEDLALRLRQGSRDDGRIVLQGSYGPTAAGDDLRVSGVWLDARFESPAVPEVMYLVDAVQLAEQYTAYEMAGKFDGIFFYESSTEQRERGFEIEMHPHELSLLRDDTRINVTLDDDTVLMMTPGQVAVPNASGTINESAFSVTGSLAFDTNWQEALFDIGFDGYLSDPQVRAIMPVAVQEAMYALEFTEAKPSMARDCRLRLWNRADDPTRVDNLTTIDSAFTGRITSRDAALLAGVEFDHVVGNFDVNYNSVAGEDSLTVDVAVDEMDVIGQRVTDATTVLELIPERQSIAVRNARGECYGGALVVEAQVGLDENRDYSLTVDLVGVGLAEMFETAVPREMTQDGSIANAKQVGELYGKLVMAGVRNAEPSQARGRGSIRVVDAAMARMPITLRLIQLLELMPPLSESFNYADASFYVEGERLVFEEILLECPTLQLIGTGDMVMETMEIDWILRSRGTLSLIRELVGGVSNTLFGIRVTGPLKDPAAELVPIPVIGEPAIREQQPRDESPNEAADAMQPDEE